MKTRLFKGLMALVLVCLMAACGAKTPTPEAVAAKIAANETLTEADYTTMIDYCGKYAEKAQKYYDIINAQPNDSTAEYNRAASDLPDLYGSDKYLDTFRNCLAQTDLSKLGKENEKKVNDFAKYQGFPLPQGEGADLRDPNVVGMIEDMPDTTVTETTGVISTGDGEAVDVNVK